MWILLLTIISLLTKDIQLTLYVAQQLNLFLLRKILFVEALNTQWTELGKRNKLNGTLLERAILI